MNIDASKFESLLLHQTHLIDVRAPIEFSEGAIPGAVNLPLLTNDERHQVGLTYKILGKEKAIELGHQIVNGDVKDQRLNLWISEIKKHPESVIYCFRGGLRSQTVQKWLSDAGVHCPIVTGGYKALRNYLLHVINEKTNQIDFHVVRGKTGSGKTDYLYHSQKPFLDLEGLAKHRGSAFGARPEPQPNQTDFENLLALEILKLSKIKAPVLIESESRMIGQIYLPINLHQMIVQGHSIFLDIPLETRIENIFKDYILNSRLGTHQDLNRFDELQNSVKAISRKLGGLRSQEILNDLNFSKIEFIGGRGLDSNRVWIRKLLVWYYDLLYLKVYPKSAP